MRSTSTKLVPGASPQGPMALWPAFAALPCRDESISDTACGPCIICVRTPRNFLGRHQRSHRANARHRRRTPGRRVVAALAGCGRPVLHVVPHAEPDAAPGPEPAVRIQLGGNNLIPGLRTRTPAPLRRNARNIVLHRIRRRAHRGRDEYQRPGGVDRLDAAIGRIAGSPRSRRHRGSLPCDHDPG